VVSARMVLATDSFGFHDAVRFTSIDDDFRVCEQLAHHKAEALQDAFQPWQLSDMVLSVFNVGVEQRGIQVGALVVSKIKSVDEARYLYCGFLEFRDSCFGELKVFHLVRKSLPDKRVLTSARTSARA